MNPIRIYTRKTVGLDNRVWRLMLLMILLPIALLSYTLLDEKKCAAFSFKVKSLGVHANDVFYTGETISFIASAAANDISWDFGDNTGAAGATVHHQFLKEGIYLVSAGSNSLCATSSQITIKNPPPPPVQTSENDGETIVGPASCYTFTEQIFTWPGPAGSYEWTIPNHQSLGTKTGQTITYTFPYAGTYTLQVELDHDRRKRHTLDVIVQEAAKPKILVPQSNVPVLEYHPPAPESSQKEDTNQKPIETPPPAADNKTSLNVKISEEGFLINLEKIQSREWTMANFEQYGVTESTPVTVNHKEHYDFKQLCAEIVKKKRRGLRINKEMPKLESVKLQYINKVISNIEVNW